MNSASFPLSHQTHYRVIYGDTDTMGVVYHANYLRWFEIGRSELFRWMGLPYREIEARGFMLPVSDVRCKYLAPARYDDLVAIQATLNPAFRAGMQFDYVISSEDGRVTHATGYTRHAFVTKEGKVVRPPDFIRDQIRMGASDTG